mgnify:CR=1 FL=1
MPVEVFKRVMAVIIFISGIMLIVMQRIQKDKIPHSKIFAIIMGLGAGFTTMVGNLAGAFSNIYFLAMRLPKNQFIGTAAWLFFIINIIKLPFHIFSWKTITVESLIINLKLIPAIILGLIIGVFLVRIIKDQFYRKMILILTAIGAVLIFIK